MQCINEVICAEFPNPDGNDFERELYDIVSQVMVHQPCGEHNPNALCMKDCGGVSQCSKNFPQPYIDETCIKEDGYPEYCCCANGRTARIRHPTRNGEYMTVGNEWVVLYNPYLTWKYKAHINVEVCGTIRAIKYIYKYIYKGSDRSTMEFQTNVDEIKRYVSGRYIGSAEAVWRLFEFAVHGETPSVKHLPIHLPGGHMVSFDSSAPMDEVADRIDEQRTLLMSFFDYNTHHPEAQSYLYQDFPTAFTWDPRSKEWKLLVTQG